MCWLGGPFCVADLRAERQGQRESNSKVLGSGRLARPRNAKGPWDCSGGAERRDTGADGVCVGASGSFQAVVSQEKTGENVKGMSASCLSSE